MGFLEFLTQYRTLELEKLFSMFTFLGEEIITIAIICFLYWCYDKKLARIVCFTYFASGLLVQSLKLTFCVPRPWILNPTFEPSQIMRDSATGYSFPSGHTQSSCALFGSLAYTSKRTWQRILFIFFIMGVAFSRMFLGYHTPTDVLTSILITSLIIFVVNKFCDFDSLKPQKIVIFLAIYSCSILLYILVLKNLPSADLTQFSDCFKAVGAGIGFALGWYIEPLHINFNEKIGNQLTQVLKLIIGLILAVALKSGLKLVLGTSLTADTIRYFILVCFIMILYPMMFTRVLSHKIITH